MNTLAALEKALPPAEWHAVNLWLGTFFPFQQEWLLDFGRFSILDKARQIGASHTYAAACVLWGLLGETTAIVSIGQDEADEVIEKARCHSKVLEALGSQWAKLTRNKYQDFGMQSGGRVISLPSTSGARGYSGNVILDEFAYHKDPEKVWDAAGAATTHGFRLRVLSTPNGTGNLFHEMWEGLSPTWRRHSVTIDQAIADGMHVDLAQCWERARNDELLFDQLYRCSFLVSGHGFFDQRIIGAQLEKVTEPPIVQPIRQSGASGTVIAGKEIPALRVWFQPESGRQYVVSADTSEGTGGDPSASLVLERGTGRHMATLWGQFKPRVLAYWLKQVALKFNRALIAVERNEYGGTVLAALESEHPYDNLYVAPDGKLGFRTTPQSRPLILSTLEQSHRAGHFTTDDRYLLSEMRTFVVENGKPQAAGGSHDDLVMAAAIGWHIVCMPIQRRTDDWTSQLPAA